MGHHSSGGGGKHGGGGRRRGGLLNRLVGEFSGGNHGRRDDYANPQEYQEPQPRPTAAAQPSINCQKCNVPNSVNAKFCNSCGEKIAQGQFCNQCGVTLAANAKFCAECGTKQAA